MKKFGDQAVEPQKVSQGEMILTRLVIQMEQGLIWSSFSETKEKDQSLLEIACDKARLDTNKFPSNREQTIVDNGIGDGYSSKGVGTPKQVFTQSEKINFLSQISQYGSARAWHVT